jgi:hypothetical protein
MLHASGNVDMHKIVGGFEFAPVDPIYAYFIMLIYRIIDATKLNPPMMYPDLLANSNFATLNSYILQNQNAYTLKTHLVSATKL